MTSMLYSVTSRETNTCNERSTSGLICQSCELIATCVMINGQWLTVPVEMCDVDAGFFCNLNVQGCSNETGPCHPFGFEGNFACTSEGVFPDPYDCQKYHMCYSAGSTLASANIECGSNKAFSAATGDCSLSINDTICQDKQYNCTNAGDSGSWPGNLNIFYICKATLDHGHRILYPTLYRCASGEVFDDRNCVARADFNGSIVNPIGVNAPFICKRGGLHPDPENCQSYYYCDVLMRSKRYTCPNNAHFDAKRKSCVRGLCN